MTWTALLKSLGLLPFEKKSLQLFESQLYHWESSDVRYFYYRLYLSNHIHVNLKINFIERQLDKDSLHSGDHYKECH